MTMRVRPLVRQEMALKAKLRMRKKRNREGCSVCKEERRVSKQSFRLRGTWHDIVDRMRKMA